MIKESKSFLLCRKFLLTLSLSVFVFLLFSSAPLAHAMTPTLSLSGNGDGDTVQVNVTGDPNTGILLFYTKSGAGQQINSLGTTNASGTLTMSVSTSQYGVVSGSTAYVVEGLNGPQSATVAWPAIASMLSPSNMLSLSQTGLVLSIGQSATVTASNIGTSSIYLSNNSSAAIANFNVSGSQITVQANSYGSTTGTFCLISNSSNCGSIYVIVQNSNAQPLSFSQSSVSLSSGQTVTIQISGGSGTYSVVNNVSQNNGAVATSISGSNITLTTASTTGASSITVCSTNMTSCGIINVTIGNVASSSISFSQTNPTVTVAQSLNISIFGPTNSLFYVASNSNPNVVQPNLSGTTLSLLGITNGTSTINICVSASSCGSLTVTVNSDSSTGGQIMLSQYSAALGIGQNASVTVSGGSMPYHVLSNNNVAQANLNGNVVTLSGLSVGTSQINVCSASGNCATLSVTVSGSNPTASTLPTGCASTFGYSQTTGQICSSVYTPAPIVTIPPDCTGTMYSISTGQACPASTVITNPVITPTVVTPVVTSTTSTIPSTSSTSSVFKFTKSLNLGSKGTEVTQLQKKLKTLGFYTGKIDGGFGVNTEKAVKAFQKAHKLSQVGSVGPQTRALLNK